LNQRDLNLDMDKKTREFIEFLIQESKNSTDELYLDCSDTQLIVGNLDLFSDNTLIVWAILPITLIVMLFLFAYLGIGILFLLFLSSIILYVRFLNKSKLYYLGFTIIDIKERTIYHEWTAPIFKQLIPSLEISFDEVIKVKSVTTSLNATKYDDRSNGIIIITNKNRMLPVLFTYSKYGLIHNRLLFLLKKMAKKSK